MMSRKDQKAHELHTQTCQRLHEGLMGLEAQGTLSLSFFALGEDSQ